MRTRYPLIALLFLLPSLSFSQGFGLPPGFDVKLFQKNEETALWYHLYDSMITRVMNYDRALEGKDFVCYQDKKGWKVVSGTLDSSGIKDAKFFVIDTKNEVSVPKKKFDTVLVASYARAMYNANQQLKKLNLNPPGGWKKYMKQNADLTITISMFCDMETNGNVWYGPECNWWYSSDGRTVVTQKIVNKAPMMAVSAGKSITLSCPTERMPTVGSIWLAHRIRTKYPEVNVNYKTGTSTLYYNEAERSYSWQHAAN